MFRASWLPLTAMMEGVKMRFFEIASMLALSSIDGTRRHIRDLRKGCGKQKRKEKKAQRQNRKNGRAKK